MLDSGSPVSLIKENVLERESYEQVSPNNYAYYGVNGSRLEVKGIFERTIKVNRSPVKIKFFVVPNSTMLFAMTLGCDYILAAN